MNRFQLKDKKGKTLKIVEAETKSEADLVGLKTYPYEYSRAEDLGVVEEASQAGFTLLKESFERRYLQEGKTEEQARRMADIAARGRVPTWP